MERQKETGDTVKDGGAQTEMWKHGEKWGHSQIENVEWEQTLYCLDFLID